MRRAVVLAAALAALLAAAVAAGPAGAATPRASFNDVEAEVMCDTCNVPLNIAESPRADQERREIRALIAQGLTKQQIEDELVRRYGSEILADPPKHGFSLAVLDRARRRGARARRARGDPAAALAPAGGRRAGRGRGRRRARPRPERRGRRATRRGPGALGPPLTRC